MPKANRNISAKLLAMRFMQREGEQKVTQEIEEREKAQQSEAHWHLPKSRRPKRAPKVRVEYVSDYLSLTQTVGNGRRTFQMAKSTKHGGCSSCGALADALTFDTSEGCQVCTACGLVLEQSVLADTLEHVNASHRTYQSDWGLRLGIAVDHTITHRTADAPSDAPLATSDIPAASVAAKAVHRRSNAAAQRRAKEVSRVMTFIRRVAAAVQLSGLVDRCQYLFHLALAQQPLRLGRAGELAAGACLVLAAREASQAVRIQDVATALGTTRFELGKVLRKLNAQLQIAQETSPEAYLERYINQIFAQYQELQQTLSDSEPAAVAGGHPPWEPTLPNTELSDLDRLFDPPHRRPVIELAGAIHRLSVLHQLGTGFKPDACYGAVITMTLQAYSYAHLAAIYRHTTSLAGTAAIGPLNTSSAQTPVPATLENHATLNPAGVSPALLRRLVGLFFSQLGGSEASLSARLTELQRLIVLLAHQLPWGQRAKPTHAYQFIMDVVKYHTAVQERLTQHLSAAEQSMSNRVSAADVEKLRMLLKRPSVQRAVSAPHTFCQSQADIQRAVQLDQAKQLMCRTQPNSTFHTSPAPSPSIAIEPIHLLLQRLLLAGVDETLLLQATTEQLSAITRRIEHPTPPCTIAKAQFEYDLCPDNAAYTSEELKTGCCFCGQWHGYKVRKRNDPSSALAQESQHIQSDATLTDNDLAPSELQLYLK
ncbi:hypothetical protein H4R34_005033 [Dimargaris verticillata]|uniref:GATA-type domain-containing protein n=1 Tax=Dimargaris verticillata TaxID=2761393 RepID=A0A9W8AX76_9FUNG|nr:hypothetical protein H4R34_005033 [Dimargaris verticillata]